MCGQTQHMFYSGLRLCIGRWYCYLLAILLLFLFFFLLPHLLLFDCLPHPFLPLIHHPTLLPYLPTLSFPPTLFTYCPTLSFPPTYSPTVPPSPSLMPYSSTVPSVLPSHPIHPLSPPPPPSLFTHCPTLSFPLHPLSHHLLPSYPIHPLSHPLLPFYTPQFIHNSTLSFPFCP